MVGQVMGIAAIGIHHPDIGVEEIIPLEKLG